MKTTVSYGLSAAAMAPPIPQQEFLGVPFAALDMASVLQVLDERPAAAPFVYIATPNTHHLVLLQRGVDGFAFGLSHAWFLPCDSQVLRRLAQIGFGITLPVVTGSDLTIHLLRQVIRPEDPVTIIGGSAQLKRDLAEQYGLRRIALYSPPFGFSRDPEQVQRCVEFVRDHPARFVFLACGAPQSEALGAHIVASGGASGIGLCIGSALLFATGQMKRAPRLWQVLCLEWLYRLAQERRRMAARLWRAQLPVLRIAATAWLSALRGGEPHASRLQRDARPMAPTRLSQTRDLMPVLDDR